MPRGDNPITGKAFSQSEKVTPVANQSTAPINPISGLPMTGLTQSTGQEVQVNPDTWDEYTRLSSHPFAGDPNANQLGNLQSGWEQAKNAILGGGVNVAAGFMDALGSWDLRDTVDMAAGVDKEYGNWFHDKSKELSEITQNQFPIYEREPGSVSPSDPGWWATQAQSLGFTIGFAGEALAEQLVLGALTGGTANEVAAASKIKALSNITRAGKVSAGKSALWGMFKGMQEATTNGYQTFDETKQRFIDKGYSEEESTKLASVAASEGFKAEVGPLMALNALQYSTLAYNPVSRKAISPFSGIKSKGVRNVVSTGSEMLSEGLEEGYQTIASMEGKNRADVMAGLKKDSKFSDRIGEYLNDAEVWNSAIGGLLGGTVFAGTQHIKNTVFGNRQEKDQQAIYKRYEQGLKGMTIDYLKQIREAEDAGVPEKASQLRRDMSVQTALQSHHIDQLKGEGNILNTHVATLQGILDAANSGDQETLDLFKIDAQSAESVKQTFPDLIKDAQDAVNIYNNIKNTNDESVLIPIAYRQHLLGKLQQEVTSAGTSIQTAQASIPDAKNLSTEGQTLLNSGYLHEALTLQEADLKRQLKKAKGTDADTIREALNSIGIRRAAIDAQRQSIMSNRENALPGTLLQDQEILRAIPHQSELLKAQQRKLAAETEISRTRKELGILNDKKYQVATAQQKREQLIDEATTPSEVDGMVASMKEKGQVTPALENKAEAKKRQLQAQQAGQSTTQEVRANKEVVVPQTPTVDFELAGDQPASNTPTNTSTTSNGGNTIPVPNSTPVVQTQNELTPPEVDYSSEEISPIREELAQGLDFSDESLGSPIEWTDSSTTVAPITTVSPFNLSQFTVKFKGVDGTSIVETENTDKQVFAYNPTTGQAILNEPGFEFAKSNPKNYLGDVFEGTSVVSDTPFNQILVEPAQFKDGKLIKKGKLSIKSQTRPANVTIVQDESLAFMPDRINPNATLEQQAKVKSRVFDYVDQLAADRNKEVGEIGFRDFINDAIKHSDKETVEKNFDYLKEGWKLNGFKESDYDRDYKVIFGSRVDLVQELFSAINEAKEPQSQSELEDKVDEVIEEVKPKLQEQVIEEAPTGQIIETKRLGELKTVRPNLKLAFLNVGYTEQEVVGEDGVVRKVKVNEDVPLVGTDIDSRSLMDPTKYLPGTKLTVTVADNLDDIMVTEWNEDFTKQGVSFSSWMAKNAVEEGSQAWKDKVPMIVRNSEGQAISMIHDLDWYNPVNVGMEDNPEMQAEVIAKAKEELRQFRQAVGNGIEVEITEKKLGSLQTIPKDQSLRTLNEINPQTLVGVANNEGTLFLGGTQSITSAQLLTRLDGKPQQLNAGEVYDIRHVGMIEVNGKMVKQYLALPVFKPRQSSQQVIDTVTQATAVYLGQNDRGGLLMPVAQRESIHKEVLRITGLNLYDSAQYEQYVNQFVRTERGNFSREGVNGKYDRDLSLQAIYSYVNGKDKVGEYAPYLAIQKGAVVYGINNKKLAKTNAKFADPDYINVNPQQAVKGYNDILSAISKTGAVGDTSTVLQRMSHNINERALGSTSPMAWIDGQGNVSQGKPYVEYLKDTLETNAKAYNIGTEAQPNYVTLVQPVINFSYETVSQKQETNAQVGGVVTEISDENLRQELEDNKDLFDKYGFDINGLLGDVAFSPNYSGDTDALIQSVKANMTKVGNMDIQSRNDTVRFIARQIEAQVDTKYHATISKDVVTDAAKDIFERTIGPEYKRLNDMVKALTPLFESGNKPQLGPVIEKFQRTLNQIDLVRDNWQPLLAEALEEVYKNTGITEVTKTFKDMVTQVLDLYKNKKVMLSPEAVEILKKAKQGDESVTKDAVEIYNTVVGTVPEDQQQDLDLEEIDIAEYEDGDTEGLKSANFSKTSLQENGKVSTNYIIRRLLNRIPQYGYGKTTPQIGFAGLTIYPGFDEYYDRIGALLTSPVDVTSNYEQITQRLLDNSDSQPWIPSLLQMLEQGDQQLKNAFAYDMALHGASFKFVMHSKTKKGDKYTLKVYDTNANEITRVIENQWYENFKMSELVNKLENGYELNTEVASKLISQFESWKNTKSGVPSLPEAREWLTKFGIFLSPESMKELGTKGYNVTARGNQYTTVKYEDMFAPSTTSNGIFGVLYATLKSTINEANNGNKALLNVTEGDSKGNPLNNTTKLLGRISGIEKKYSKHVATTSIRDGDKNSYGLTSQKMATQQLRRLKSDEQYRQDLGELSFNGSSYILGLLNADMDFREKFMVDHLGINAIKELGKKLYKSNEITGIPESDHELTKLGFFQDIQQGEIRDQQVVVNGRSFSFKMGLKRMFFPTMSDKSQMLDITVPAIIMRKGNELMLNDRGEVILSDSSLAFAFSQLVEPELKRMLSHHQRAKRAGKHPNELANQKSYNMGAQIFIGIPELNNLIYKGVTLPNYIAENSEHINSDHYNQMIMDMKEEISNFLQGMFKQRVENKLKVWQPFISQKDGQLNGTQFMNTEYMNSFGESDVNKRLQYAAYDYIFNSYISNANISMLFAGDPANYSQDKAFKKGFLKDSQGKIAPYMAVSPEAYVNAIKNVTDINIGKRLALLIAPGKSLANSTGDKYVQLFLQDRVTNTTNIPFLIDLYYGASSETQEVKQWINDLSSEVSGVADSARGNLQNAFPQIADYFEIESTDAQEYTTAKESVDILYRQGRLHSSVYNSIMDKLTKQYEDEKAGRQIGKENFLNDKELKLILQPIKPVYSGQVIDKANDVSRVMYIKSSSFPLLPQVTQGTELDGLRRDMESIQQSTGKNVRASYDTANKVGAVLPQNQIRVWDNTGKYIPMDTQDISNKLNKPEDHGQSVRAMILDREHFRIQQDVPYKSSKRVEDTISLGTQDMKILFGDGVKQITDSIFEIDGQTYNGQGLYELYTNAFGDWISTEKTKLYEQVGIDEATGKPINPAETGKKLQAILQEEATKRGYPLQDVDALSIEADGAFSLPVWLSPNSNRYEALLNAIVANRLINLKMPGNSFVAGSEEGFRTSNSTSGISNIVYTESWTGELKAATYDEAGNLLQAQVIIPSKFRNNKGELIDLIKDGYAIKSEDGGWKLNPAKVSKELLSMSSFRIPTSGHVSLSQIEIVGFLPQEQGDLMIVPKNFTKQKGLDFDVDKENTYQLWHTVDKAGNLTVLDSSNSKDKTKLAQNQIVKIHAAILGNKEKVMQQKINKVLSMDFAREQAVLISAATQTSQQFSIWDDEHQKYKLGLGAAGKSGIGTYSNYVVFHNLIQQAEGNIQLINEEGALEIQIGKFKSDGKMGRVKTLDGDRTIGEVLAERQNTATDNEKEQIMGRVGVNDLTINVDSLLTALGFDKAQLDNGRQVSIPYLILSQPIIKDYVRMMKAARSTTAGFQRDAEERIIATLMENYQSEAVAEGSELTGQLLYDNLTKPSNSHQMAVLNLFTQLKAYAKEAGQIQSRLNIQNSGLGKSIFEMLEKYQNVERMIGSAKFSGISSLVGDFIEGDSYTNLPTKELIKDGYLIFNTKDGNQFAVRPTTPVGHMVTQAAKSGYELWSDFFPHNHPVIKATMNDILDELSDEELSESTRIQRKYEVMQELKKYLFSSQQLGLFTGDPQQERARLFIDSETNTSLATYLSEIVEVNSPSTNVVANNKLISALTYTLNKNGEISQLKYNSAKGEDTNEEYKYSALIELMDRNEVIRNQKGEAILFNGQEYSTRMLAKDMILYAYIQGGIQKATEIVKYIPVPYLKASGFATTSRQWQAAAKSHNVMLSNGEEWWQAMMGYNGQGRSRFMKQYFQHNPSRAAQVTQENMDMVNREGSGKASSGVVRFTVKQESGLNDKQFLKIHVSKDEQYLFQNDGTGVFNKIPVLGTSGMDEYSIRANDYQSVVNPKVAPASVSPVPQKNQSAGDTNKHSIFKLNEGNLQQVLTEIGNSKHVHYAALAKTLLPFIDNSTKIVIGETPGTAQGYFNGDTNTITISDVHLSKASFTENKLAQLILHEFIHSITMREVRNYFDARGQWLEDQRLATAPAHIVKLHRVFNAAVQAIGQDAINDYKARYNVGNTAITNATDALAYAGLNLDEFMTMVMTDPMVQNTLNKVPYKGTDKSILQQFIESIKLILQRFGVPMDSISSEAFESVFAVAEAQAKQKKSTTFDLTSEINEAQSESMSNSDTEDSNTSEALDSPMTQIDESLMPSILSEVEAVLAQIDQC